MTIHCDSRQCLHNDKVKGICCLEDIKLRYHDNIFRDPGMVHCDNAGKWPKEDYNKLMKTENTNCVRVGNNKFKSTHVNVIK